MPKKDVRSQSAEFLHSYKCLSCSKFGPFHAKTAHANIVLKGSKIKGGSLERQDALSVLRASFHQIRHCHEVGLKKDSKLGGVFRAELSNDKSGKVQNFRTRAESKLKQAMDSCLKPLVLKWRFPPSSKPYRFSFEVELQYP